MRTGEVTIVLELICFNSLKLKAFTTLLLRYEIGLVLDVGKTKVGRY